MRNENTSSRYDSRKLRDPQRKTGKYIFSHIKVEYVFCSYSYYHKVHREHFSRCMVYDWTRTELVDKIIWKGKKWVHGSLQPRIIFVTLFSLWLNLVMNWGNEWLKILDSPSHCEGCNTKFSTTHSLSYVVGWLIHSRYHRHNNNYYSITHHIY